MEIHQIKSNYKQLEVNVQFVTMTTTHQFYWNALTYFVNYALEPGSIENRLAHFVEQKLLMILAGEMVQQHFLFNFTKFFFIIIILRLYLDDILIIILKIKTVRPGPAYL